MAINEKVLIGEEMSMKLTPSPKVFCIKCGDHVFWLNNLNKVTPLYPVDYIKVIGVDVVNLICPKCNNNVCAFEGNTPKFKTSEGWI